MSSSDDKPTFHHMNHSQSQRIHWLLEELGVEYNLVLHYRNPPNHPEAPFRSPPSLLAEGQYGKAPLLITGAKDGSRPIPESQAIATYLIRTFDTDDTFGLRNGNWIRDDILSSVISTNLYNAALMLLMLDFGQIRNGASDRFDGPELRIVLSSLERELRENGSGDWLMGQRPGRADFLLEFPLSMVRHRGWVALEREFPALDKWLNRVYERPAWKRALEKGNGYDLSVFPKVPRL